MSAWPTSPPYETRRGLIASRHVHYLAKHLYRFGTGHARFAMEDHPSKGRLPFEELHPAKQWAWRKLACHLTWVLKIQRPDTKGKS